MMNTHAPFVRSQLFGPFDATGPPVHQGDGIVGSEDHGARQIVNGLSIFTKVPEIDASAQHQNAVRILRLRKRQAEMANGHTVSLSMQE